MYDFDYQRPADEKAAVAAFQGDARYLAGGQSLVQAMRLRLASSERLVDLGAIAALKGIRADASTVTTPPSARMPLSPAMPPRSTSRSDCDIRSRIACTRLWPPARKRVSPCAAAMAAWRSAGRW